MRQIGSLKKQADAERLAAYLVTEGIMAHAEADGEEWAIWVRDENSLEPARQAFRDFAHNPLDRRYEDVERTAAAIRREEAQQRAAARKNVVEMRGKWKSPGTAGTSTPQHAPLVFILIGLCVMASLWTKSLNGPSAMARSKGADFMRFASSGSMQSAGVTGPAAAFVDIRRGEVWRLITPIFVHIGVLHLVMNAYWMYRFGAQIENFHGTLMLGMLVLICALASNLVQAITSGPNFFGISGVVTGLFGYVWIKTKYDPTSSLFVSNFTIGFFIVYLFYCLFMDESIANAAHFVGLGVGAILAYLPVLLRSSGKR